MASWEPGAELGHYRIVRLLGRGGTGDVYLAHDLKLERDVAIKVLSAGRGDPDDARKCLLREGKAVAALARGDFPYSTGQVIMVDGGLTLPRL